MSVAAALLLVLSVGALPRIAQSPTSSVQDGPEPLTGVTTEHGWGGYLGNSVIYPTRDTNPVTLPLPGPDEVWVNGTNDSYNLASYPFADENSLTLNISNGTGIVPYYQNEGPPNWNFVSNIWVGAAGISQDYAWTTTGNFLEVWPYGLEVGVSGPTLPAGSTIQVNYEDNTGVNLTSTSDDTGTDLDGLILLAVLDTASILASGDIGILLSVPGLIADYAALFGATQGSGFPSCSDHFPPGSSLCQYASVDGGTVGTGPGNWGSDVFAQGTGVELEIPNTGLASVTAGSLTFSAYDQLAWYDLFCIPFGCTQGGGDLQGLTTNGTHEPTYGIAPAVSIGGYVLDKGSGTGAGGALVTLVQTCSQGVTDFDLTANAAGYWHFFADPGCTYSYSAANPQGTLSTGSVSLLAKVTNAAAEGNNTTVQSLTFLAGGQVVIAQSGLTGAPWTATVGGTALSANNSTLSFEEPNGTYAFSVKAGVCAPNPSSGTLTVNGNLVTEHIQLAGCYPATFVESGLPIGTQWWVNVSGEPSLSSTNRTLVTSFPNGTYSYLPSADGARFHASGGPFGILGVGSYSTVDFLSLKLIKGYSATPWENDWSYTFDFTVPAGYSHELFVWTFNDDAKATVDLPANMSSEEQFGNSTGIAYGAMTPGSYSASFSAGSGWVNTVSIAIYGISNDSGYAYQYGASQTKSLTLSRGGAIYLGVLETGGLPITSPSLTTINEEAASPPSSPSAGETDMIGTQTSNTLSFSSSAVGYGIAGAVLIPVPSIGFLTGYEATPWESPWTYTYHFTVPYGYSQEILAWSLSDSIPMSVTLPAGLSFSIGFGNLTEMAYGNLSPGSYAVTFSSGTGWVNTFSIALFGIVNDNEYIPLWGTAPHAKTLEMASGSVEYVGILETGGLPITSPSLTIVDEEAASPPSSPTTGVTDLIGSQTSDSFSFTSSAVAYGIEAMGFYYVG